MSDEENAQQEKDDAAPRVYRIASPGGRRAFLHTLSGGAAVAGAAAAAESCSSGSPTTPTPASTTTTTSARTTTTSTSSVRPLATLAGVVTDESTGRPIASARVAVVDGPSSGRSATSDGNGYYSLGNIDQTSFTARATASGYFNSDKGLTLTRDTRLDFQLRAVPQTTSTVPPTTTTPPSTTTRSSGCSCNTVCTCNPLTYYYPN